MDEQKTVEGILRDWLQENGYNGLWNDEPCGCGVDDLAPCGETPLDCMPGHKGIITETNNHDRDMFVGEVFWGPKKPDDELP